jgi:nucleoside-diphosphate-sugar epimerase
MAVYPLYVFVLSEMGLEMGLNILVTGAGGFVGAHLCPYLEAHGHRVIRGNRETGWHTQLEGVDAIVHLAAKVHVLQAKAADADAFARDNVQASVALAKQAAKAGVKRMIFISTIGVHGNGASEPLTEQSAIAPAGDYAASKWDAEQALRAVSGIEIVTLRPPLIYGAGVKANFHSLLKAIKLGLPLPFRAIHAKRDYISVTNFCSAIHFALMHPDAAGETFLLCDGEAFSTADLIRRLATHMQKPYCLWPIPQALLKPAARLLGKGALYQSVCGARPIDDRKLRALGWQPAQSADEGLRETADWFKTR